MKGAAILITGLAVLLLEGCVSMPNFTEYANRLPPPMQGEGRIWFYRQPRFVGYFYVDRPAGNYVVTCETEQINECRLVLSPQSTKYVRLTMGMGVWIAQIVPQEVSRMTALKDLADL